ncbi:MAG: c-type cytochrome [Longimicrobiales bacterium]
MKSEVPRSRAFVARLLALFLTLGLGACASGPPAAQAPTPTSPAEPLQAFFSAPQATRGQDVFTNVCSTCHGRNEFTGPIFALTWRAEPLRNLFEHISTNMPQDRPGSLTSQQYIDVVAYILRLNGIQAAERELVPDMALLARIEW